MSREITFRVWHKKEKRFVCLKAINFIDDMVTYDCQGECNYVDIAPFDDITLQQYTGFKDRNGVEIYEGDIVEFILAVQTDENGNKIGPEDSFGVYEVFYNEKRAAYFLRVHRGNWFDTMFTTEKQAAELTIDPMCPHLPCLELELGNFGITRVISNIFENPELLKNEQ